MANITYMAATYFSQRPELLKLLLMVVLGLLGLNMLSRAYCDGNLEENSLPLDHPFVREFPCSAGSAVRAVYVLRRGFSAYPIFFLLDKKDQWVSITHGFLLMRVSACFLMPPNVYRRHASPLLNTVQRQLVLLFHLFMSFQASDRARPSQNALWYLKMAPIIDIPSVGLFQLGFWGEAMYGAVALVSTALLAKNYMRAQLEVDFKLPNVLLRQLASTAMLLTFEKFIRPLHNRYGLRFLWMLALGHPIYTSPRCKPQLEEDIGTGKTAAEEAGFGAAAPGCLRWRKARPAAAINLRGGLSAALACEAACPAGLRGGTSSACCLHELAAPGSNSAAVGRPAAESGEQVMVGLRPTETAVPVGGDEAVAAFPALNRREVCAEKAPHVRLLQQQQQQQGEKGNEEEEKEPVCVTATRTPAANTTSLDRDVPANGGVTAGPGSGAGIEGAGLSANLGLYMAFNRTSATAAVTADQLLSTVTTTAAAGPGPRQLLCGYVGRTRLVCTRIKIQGVHPTDVQEGYQQRIAAVLTAANMELEGVYIRPGCIELVIDARTWSGRIAAAPSGPAPSVHTQRSRLEIRPHYQTFPVAVGAGTAAPPTEQVTVPDARGVVGGLGDSAPVVNSARSCTGQMTTWTSISASGTLWGAGHLPPPGKLQTPVPPLPSACDSSGVNDGDSSSGGGGGDGDANSIPWPELPHMDQITTITSCGGDGDFNGSGVIDVGELIRALKLPGISREHASTATESLEEPNMMWGDDANGNAVSATMAAAPIAAPGHSPAEGSNGGFGGDLRGLVVPWSSDMMRQWAAPEASTLSPSPLPRPLSPQLLSVSPRVLLTRSCGRSVATMASPPPTNTTITICTSEGSGSTATDSNEATGAATGDDKVVELVLLVACTSDRVPELVIRSHGAFLPATVTACVSVGAPAAAGSRALDVLICTVALPLAALPDEPGLLVTEVRCDGQVHGSAVPLLLVDDDTEMASELQAAVEDWRGPAMELEDMLLDLACFLFHARRLRLSSPPAPAMPDGVLPLSEVPSLPGPLLPSTEAGMESDTNSTMHDTFSGVSAAVMRTRVSELGLHMLSWMSSFPAGWTHAIRRLQTDLDSLGVSVAPAGEARSYQSSHQPLQQPQQQQQRQNHQHQYLDRSGDELLQQHRGGRGGSGGSGGVPEDGFEEDLDDVRSADNRKAATVASTRSRSSEMGTGGGSDGGFGGANGQHGAGNMNVPTRWAGPSPTREGTGVASGVVPDGRRYQQRLAQHHHQQHNYRQHHHQEQHSWHSSPGDASLNSISFSSTRTLPAAAAAAAAPAMAAAPTADVALRTPYDGPVAVDGTIPEPTMDSCLGGGMGLIMMRMEMRMLQTLRMNTRNHEACRLTTTAHAGPCSGTSNATMPTTPPTRPSRCMEGDADGSSRDEGMVAKEGPLFLVRRARKLSQHEQTHRSPVACISALANAAFEFVRAFGVEYPCLLTDEYRTFETHYTARLVHALNIVTLAGILVLTIRTRLEIAANGGSRPLLLRTLVPPLVSCLPSCISTLSRPFLSCYAWERLLSVMRLPQLLAYCVAGALIAWAGFPAAGAIRSHQLGAAAFIGDGIVQIAASMLRPLPALMVALIRMPIHIALWSALGAPFGTVWATVRAVAVVCLSFSTSICCHAFLLGLYRLRQWPCPSPSVQQWHAKRD